MIFTLSQVFLTSPAALYQAWLNSQMHTEMTGGLAESNNTEGASFSAWDGYITGKNIALIENSTIKQTWRTSEFKETDEDSIVTIELSQIGELTQFKLTHENLPEDHGEQYILGWKQHYFDPMSQYFQGIQEKN